MKNGRKEVKLKKSYKINKIIKVRTDIVTLNKAPLSNCALYLNKIKKIAKKKNVIPN